MNSETSPTTSSRAPLIERVSSWFKSVRAAEGLSLQEMAQKIGCTKQNLHLVESGKSPPSLALIARTENAFNVSLF